VHVFRAAAMLAQNAVIERLAKKDVRISWSKNKKMRDSSTEEFRFRVFRVFRGNNRNKNALCGPATP
jgi:hypothetical protein